MLSYAHLQNNASNSLIHNPHRETETFFNIGHILSHKTTHSKEKNHVSNHFQCSKIKLEICTETQQGKFQKIHTKY